jgi:L-ascorbate 6-phosphate lactonase
MLWWLGQAGFAFKTATGTIVYVDPYLSHAVERMAGFKRLSLPPIEAEEVAADLFVLTHEHADHLDPDALPVIAERNRACIFAAPSGCAEGLAKAGIGPDRRVLLEPGKAVTVRGVTVHAAGADHGGFSPSAVSVALDLGGVRVMMSGDTSWRPDLFQPLYELGLDVLIPCINGSFGNMGHIDAARMAGESGARIAIPCHFWTFAEQGAGDPMGFVTACLHFGPKVRALLLSPGSGLAVDGG